MTRKSFPRYSFLTRFLPNARVAPTRQCVMEASIAEENISMDKLR